MPGGKVESGESPTEAAVREAKEEIGVDVKLRKPFFSGEFQHNEQIFLWHGYLAETSGKPKVMEQKFSELDWLTASELDDVDLAPNLRQILPAIRKVLKAAEE